MDIEIYGYVIRVPSNDEWHKYCSSRNALMQYEEITPLHYLIYKTGNKLFTAQTITDYIEIDYENSFILRHPDPETLLKKIQKDFPNINQVDVRVWFEFIYNFDCKELLFVKTPEKMTLNHHRILRLNFIDKYPYKIVDPRIIRDLYDGELPESIEKLDKIMKVFDLLEYAVKQGNIVQYESILIDNHSKHLEKYSEFFLPKRGNCIRYALMKKKYGILPYIPYVKEDWDECQELLIKSIPTIMQKNELTKDIMVKFDNIVDWKKYSQKPHFMDNCYKITNKSILEYVTINTQLDAIEMLYNKFNYPIDVFINKCNFCIPKSNTFEELNNHIIKMLKIKETLLKCEKENEPELVLLKYKSR